MSPPPSEEIPELMRFIAEKVENVKSPKSIRQLANQFKEETGALMPLNSLQKRVRTYSQKIHKMDEFDKVTEVKLMFAISASIDAGFLIELKKAANVEVDDQQRIIQYKQNDSKLELSAKHLRVPMKMGEQQNREMIQFLAEKSKTTDKPFADIVLLREFKASTGCTDSMESLKYRYHRVKNTIYQSTEIDKNTRIKMLFISNMKLSDETLKELQKDADVEVDEEGRITEYKSKDGRLNLEGNHRISTVSKLFHSDRWKIYKKKQIDFVRFLISRTENVISPLSINNLAKDFETEFKSSNSVLTTEKRIRSFRQRIHTMNQFNTQTKVKLVFALSASIDADFLKELQKDSIVELDEKQRIKKYNAINGSLNLEGDHSVSAKRRSEIAERKKKTARGFNDLSDSEDSEFANSQSLAAVPRGRKRAREILEDEESLKQEDDWSMDFESNNADNFDYDPSKYELDMDHLPVEKKPESLIEVKTEEPEVKSSSNGGGYYKVNFPDYGLLNDVDDMDHIPKEKKQECLIEVKTEESDGPSTSNLEYQYEDNMDHILIEPKPEFSE